MPGKRFILSGLSLFVLLLLTACNGASANTPQQITAKNRSNTSISSQGALVIATPSPVPGGPKGSQEIVLSDRTLIIYTVSKEKSAQANSVLIRLNLAVANTSGSKIQNLPTFFQLIGLEGDTFSYQYDSTDTFYGSVAAHTTDTGSIAFELPSAATTTLSLLYHPEIAQEAVIVKLTIT